SCRLASLFFFTATSTPAIYTLSLHDALPIFLFGDFHASYSIVIDDQVNRCQYTRTRKEIRQVQLSDITGIFYKFQLVIAVLFGIDRKSTRLNSSHVKISYAVFCLKKKKEQHY